MRDKLRNGDQRLIAEKTGYTQRWVNKVLGGNIDIKTDGQKKIVRLAKLLIRNRNEFLKSA